jgi:hypothetical protein
MSEDSITDEWLKGVGFKWHQLERQPNKHWLLWLGDAVGQGLFTSFEDIGIEVTSGQYLNSAGELVGDPKWFSWLRSDAAGRYHRFIHLRHISTRGELIALIEAISGQAWNPSNHLYGSLRTPEQAEGIRRRDQELDRRLTREGYPWSDLERDESVGRPLPEHLVAARQSQAGSQ